MIKRYLSLLKKSLVNEIYLENELRIYQLVAGKLYKNWPPFSRKIDFKKLHHIGKYFQEELDQLKSGRREGKLINVNTQHLVYADTMIGMKRLDNIQSCLDTIIDEKIKGDVIECGVWRGGASIFMKAYFQVHGIRDRNVWLADSFQGVPSSTYEQDKIVDMSQATFPGLAIPLSVVKENFQKYDITLENVHFLEGWFKDTLFNAPIDQLSVLRMDGDLYESTWDILVALYEKVNVGGFIIVDDYGALPQCKEAIHEFRNQNGISEPMIKIDYEAVYWRKGRDQK